MIPKTEQSYQINIVASTLELIAPVYSDMIEKGRLYAEYLQSMDIDDDLKQALMEVISDRNKD